MMKKSYLPYLIPFIAFLVLTYAGSYLFTSFKLSKSSLEKLRDERISDDILDRLTSLEEQEFAQEREFLSAVEQQIGEEHTSEYKKPIVKHARLSHGTYIFYPIKTLIVAVLLFYYRQGYAEITMKFSWLAVLVGIVVFIIWVVPEGWYPHLGSSEFHPYTYGKNWLAYTLIAFRLFGAAIVVPVFEELFWRSFAIRWIIDEDFHSVPIGKFTWFSCCVIVLGFGFEHHRWLVGLLAGALYNALLYYKKDLSGCILAHAVTNLLLGIYVLQTQQWTFW